MHDTDQLTEHHPAARSSRLKSRLLTSVAVLALLSGSAAGFATHALSAATVFGPTINAAARTPASAVAVPGFSTLVEAVKPAVVSVRIRAEEGTQSPSSADQPKPFEGTPFEKFFKDFPWPDAQGGSPGQPGARPHRIIQGQGSGFFISADGYIVTNNHVVDHATKVEVVTDNGKTYQAKVIGTDPKTDLALIKVDAGTDFPFVKLAETMPKIGDWVVAMGNPFGLGGTVTAGIVSAEGRDIGSGPYDNYIQIDAPVNRGNSGGPTFNLKGEVIGVNTAIYSPSGGSVGIAFDIPASTIAAVIPQLKAHGRVERGWLGVQIQPVSKEIADSVGLTAASGALVTAPQPDSPAMKAGLKPGDVILSLNGTDVKGPKDLAKRVAGLGPNHSVDLAIWRSGRKQDVKLTLGQMAEKTPRVAAANTGKKEFGKLGLSVAPASQIEGAGDKGLVVVAVDPSGKGAELGLQAGDIILRAGNRDVARPSDVTTALADAKAAGRSNALLLFRRNNTEQFIAVPAAGVG
ncbi:MAG: Do family serine endopeptidase [Thermomicrobiales bacterium]